MKRRVLGVLVLALVVAVGAYVWYVHFNYRFETISAGRVYKSGVIPPERIADYVETLWHPHGD